MRDLGTPVLGCDLGRLGPSRGHRLQFVSAGRGSGDQLAIELALFVLPAAVLDGAGPLLGQAPPIAPLHRRRPRQRPVITPRRAPSLRNATLSQLRKRLRSTISRNSARNR